MAEFKVAGVWLRSLGHVSAGKWSTHWGSGPCGSDAASCAVAVSPTSDSPLLKINQPFEVWSDGVKVFGGVTTQPASGFPWALSAKGLGRRADDFLAKDSSGDPTTNPRTAVTQAIARGLEWSNPNAFPNVSIGEDGDVPQMQRLSALLDDWGITAGKRWGVDVNGVAFVADEPSDPAYLLDAADLPIGVATDGLFTRVDARYVSSVDGGTGDPNGWLSESADDAAAQEMFGIFEFPMDLNRLGYLTGGGTTALDYATKQLALMTVPQWLNRVLVEPGRLRNLGGTVAHHRSVSAGQVVRLFNVPNTLGGLRNELALDVVLGEAEYDVEAEVPLTIGPVNLAVRNMADAFAEAARTARAVGTAGVNTSVWAATPVVTF